MRRRSLCSADKFPSIENLADMMSTSARIRSNRSTFRQILRARLLPTWSLCSCPIQPTIRAESGASCAIPAYPWGGSRFCFFSPCNFRLLRSHNIADGRHRHRLPSPETVAILWGSPPIPQRGIYVRLALRRPPRIQHAEQGVAARLAIAFQFHSWSFPFAASGST